MNVNRQRLWLLAIGLLLFLLVAVMTSADAQTIDGSPTRPPWVPEDDEFHGTVEAFPYLDKNGDGLSDGDSGIAGVYLELYNSNGELVCSSVSSEWGAWCYHQPIGQYTATITGTSPSMLASTPLNVTVQVVGNQATQVRFGFWQLPEFEWPYNANWSPWSYAETWYAPSDHGPLSLGAGYDGVSQLSSPGNFSQGFCPTEGEVAVQSNWVGNLEPSDMLEWQLRDLGFFPVLPQDPNFWNLGPNWPFWARNKLWDYTEVCPEQPTPTPEPTTEPTNTPQPSATATVPGPTGTPTQTETSTPGPSPTATSTTVPPSPTATTPPPSPTPGPSPTPEPQEWFNYLPGIFNSSPEEQPNACPQKVQVSYLDHTEVIDFTEWPGTMRTLGLFGAGDEVKFQMVDGQATQSNLSWPSAYALQGSGPEWVFKPTTTVVPPHPGLGIPYEFHIWNSTPGQQYCLVSFQLQWDP